MNRGSSVRILYLDLGRTASMRPRFMNRGSRGGDIGTPGPARASMRPRFMNRGSDIKAPGIDPPAPGLQ